MRGYYYDQTGEAPRSTPAPIFAGRRRRWSGAAAVLLFLLTMALLGGLTAAAGLWSHSRLEELPALADSTWQPLPVREELPEETTVERAPTGDGTTLTISPLPSGGAHSLQEIYRENIASIVSIRGSKGDGMSLGTGVVMSEDGYIITNSHVIEGCGAVDVVLQDERVFQALLVGQDAQSDLAVLKIDCAGLTPAQFGDSTLLEVGDAVAAIGNPLGEELRGTMTDGIISAINRDVNVDGYTMVLLQTTAALNSGNSGGALINDRGQVVGITNLKMRAYDNTVEGLGFAIPTTTVGGGRPHRPRAGGGPAHHRHHRLYRDGGAGGGVRVPPRGGGTERPGGLRCPTAGRPAKRRDRGGQRRDDHRHGPAPGDQGGAGGGGRAHLPPLARRPLPGAGRGPGGPVHAGGVDKKRAPRPGAPKRDVCGRMEESRVGITLAYWISCALIIL